MVDLRLEAQGGWFEGVFGGEAEMEGEDTALGGISQPSVSRWLRLSRF